MEEAEKIVQKIMEDERRREGEERKKRIEESKYNIHYKDIRTEKLQEYLRGRRRKKERNGIARYRCGNETKGSQYWRGEEERKCRICGKAEENLMHVLKECEETKSEISVEELLRENGGGWERMKEIGRAREERRRKNEESGTEE